MLMVIHENNLGAYHIGTTHEQNLLLEAFCNEYLKQNNVQEVAEEGPLVYKEAKDVLEEVWHANLEGVEKRKDANEVYSAFATTRQCDAP